MHINVYFANLIPHLKRLPLHPILKWSKYAFIKSQIGSSVSSIVLSANTTTEQKAGASLIGIIFACLYSPSFRVVRVLGNLLTSFKLMPNVRTISVSEPSPPIGVLSPSPTLSVITESMKSLPSI